MVLHQETREAKAQAVGRSVDRLLWQGSAETARAVALFGPAILVLPLLGQVSGVDHRQSLSYASHIEGWAAVGEVSLKSKLGLLDPQTLLNELAAADEIRFQKEIWNMSDEELRDEVDALQQWFPRAKNRMKVLERRAAWSFLGITGDTATPAEVRKAFKKKALELHPDKGGDAERFQLLQEMKDVLIDKPQKDQDGGRTDEPKGPDGEDEPPDDDVEDSDQSESESELNEDGERIPKVIRKEKPVDEEEAEEEEDEADNAEEDQAADAGEAADPLAGFDRKRAEAARRRFHLDIMKAWDRSGKLAEEIRRGQTSIGGSEPLQQLRSYVDNFCNTELRNVAPDDNKAAEVAFCRFLEDGAEILCAAAATHPGRAIAIVALQVNHPLLTAAPSAPNLRRRCGALLEAIEGLPSVASERCIAPLLALGSGGSAQDVGLPSAPRRFAPEDRRPAPADGADPSHSAAPRPDDRGWQQRSKEAAEQSPEEELFSCRARLLRFRKGDWKEKGAGEVKLLQHSATGEVRFLMKQEKTLKVLAVFYVVEHERHCELRPNGGSDKCWAWTAEDYSDGVAITEQFALKLPTSESAVKFVEAFDKAKELNKVAAKMEEQREKEREAMDAKLAAAGAAKSATLAKPKKDKEKRKLDGLMGKLNVARIPEKSNEVAQRSARAIPLLQEVVTKARSYLEQVRIARQNAYEWSADPQAWKMARELQEAMSWLGCPAPAETQLTLGELFFRAGAPKKAAACFQLVADAGGDAGLRDETYALAHCGVAACAQLAEELQLPMGDNDSGETASCALAAAIAQHGRSFRSRAHANVIHDLEPEGEATMVLVLLHGAGGSPHDMLPAGEELRAAVRAPCRIVTVQGLHSASGAATPRGARRSVAFSWRDERCDPQDPFCWDSTLRAMAQIHSVVDRIEADGVAPDRIVIGGVSQGAAMAALIALTRKPRLAGLLILGGGVGERTASLARATAGPRGVPRDLPVFWGHGEEDHTPPLSSTSLGVRLLEFHSYPGNGRQLCEQMVVDISSLLRKWLRIRT